MKLVSFKKKMNQHELVKLCIKPFMTLINIHNCFQDIGDIKSVLGWLPIVNREDILSHSFKLHDDVVCV